jgi:hypothetical protein
MKKFNEYLKEKNNNVYRYIHKDGNGLMNNNSLDYSKLSDDEYFEVEEDYLSLQQPPSSLHNQEIVFAFTNKGEEKHKKLIELLTKASKKGVVREKLNLQDYEIVWNDNDEQLGLKKK